MITLPFNPHAEKTALYEAILRFRQRCHQQHTVEAVFDLCDAIESAEAICSELAQCSLAPQSELALVRINLRLLVEIARRELAQVQEETLEAIGHRIAQETRQAATSPLFSFPAGTLPTCPACEEESGPHDAQAAGQASGSSSPWLPAGTILSCPQCEEGLYKVTTRARIDDLVLDDGELLQPLNTTVPKRDAWRALACPRCRGRYYKDGKMHTVQNGWQ